MKKKLDYAGGDCKHDEPRQPPAKIGHSNDHEVCTSLQPFRDLDDADLLNEEIWTGEAKKISELFHKCEEEKLLLSRKKTLAEVRSRHEQNQEHMEFMRQEIAGCDQER